MNKGEIWLVSFPSNNGREQSGTRPSIVIANTKTSLILTIPLTSNLTALTKLPNTLKISKSTQNALKKDSAALIFQLQALDKKRFLDKIGNLEADHLEKINEILKEILKL